MTDKLIEMALEHRAINRVNPNRWAELVAYSDVATRHTLISLHIGIYVNGVKNRAHIRRDYFMSSGTPMYWDAPLV